MNNLKKKLDKKAALARAENLCARQEKCESDIRAKLTEWGLSQNDSTEIINILITNSFIDNHRYAKAFVREKSRLGKWGKIKIESSLRQKQISSEIIRLAIKEIDELNYEKTLEKELTIKYKSIKNQGFYSIKSKLIRFGISRGYENGKVFDMVNKILGNSSTE